MLIFMIMSQSLFHFWSIGEKRLVPVLIPYTLTE